MFLDSRQESSSSGKVEIFNKFFHSIFVDSLSVISPPDLSDSKSLCETISFSEDNVYQVIFHLDAKAMGIDNIPNQVLKSCAATLTRPIYHLFQKCVNQSLIPSEWRIHKVIPIFLNLGINHLLKITAQYPYYVVFQKYWNGYSLQQHLWF